MRLAFHRCFHGIFQKITPRFAKPNSIVDVTFDDMDIIAEPPWMASRRVTEAMEFGVSATRSEVLG
ncbi:hypothetical protein CBX96_02485 [Shewanella sp. BC20]|nr:hypothetical protein CBX96_02485 [Shewanella sp. BC20]